MAFLINEKRTSYTEWENETMPKGDVLKKIANAGGVSVDELLADEPIRLGEERTALADRDALYTIKEQLKQLTDNVTEMRDEFKKVKGLGKVKGGNTPGKKAGKTG